MKDNENLAIERGERLRIIRYSANLTAEELSKISGISRVSISFWENAKDRGLSRKGAEKIIQGLNSIGFNKYTVNWLLSGEENNFFSNENKDSLKTDQFILSLQKETEIFLNFNKNAVITKISDEMMSPIFKKTDVVGGILQPIDLINDEEIICIISLNNNLYLRKLTKKDNLFKLSHLNISIKENLELSVINKKSIVAPISRLWRL